MAVCAATSAIRSSRIVAQVPMLSRVPPSLVGMASNSSVIFLRSPSLFVIGVMPYRIPTGKSILTLIIDVSKAAVSLGANSTSNPARPLDQNRFHHAHDRLCGHHAAQTEAGFGEE